MKYGIYIILQIHLTSLGINILDNVGLVIYKLRFVSSTDDTSGVPRNFRSGGYITYYIK